MKDFFVVPLLPVGWLDGSSGQCPEAVGIQKLVAAKLGTTCSGIVETRFVWAGGNGCRLESGGGRLPEAGGVRVQLHC